MKKRIKDKWVAALLSGEYKQGNGNLRKGSAFCCLGVLCDLAAKAGVGEWKFDEDGDYSFLRATSILPNDVAEWAGMKSCEGTLPKDLRELHNNLWQANDGYTNVDGYREQQSFASIAFVIEGVWEEL